MDNKFGEIDNESLMKMDWESDFNRLEIDSRNVSSRTWIEKNIVKLKTDEEKKYVDSSEKCGVLHIHNYWI